MRSIMVMLVMVAALLAGGWLGGETLLARSAKRLIEADPRVAAAGVGEMREPQRIGVRIAAPRFDDPARALTAAGDWLDVWVTPQAPNELHASLAPATAVTLQDRELVLGDEGAQGYLRFSPTRGMALGEAEMTARGITLDGAQALDGVTLHAVLSGYGADAPAGTGAAYQVNGQIKHLALAALTGGAVPGLAGASGAGRVWMSEVPVKAGDVAGGWLETPLPALIGLRADGVQVTLDDLSARVYGRLLADAQGFAEGQVLIDTADAQGFVDRAAAAGVIPRGLAPITLAAINAAAQQQGAGATDGAAPRASRSVTDLPAHIAPGTEVWPAVPMDQIRIPLNFTGGQVSLGALPLGPAPRLRQPAQG